MAASPVSPAAASAPSAGFSGAASPGIGGGRPLLVVNQVSKRFGPTVALDNVSVEFVAGEVHALMGENGAGKSTLGKAIAGLHKPESGTITLEGRPLPPGSIHDAFAAGVRIVHQELAQCNNLSVAENLSLHDLPTRRGMLDRRAMAERAARLLAELAPEIDVEAPLGTLAPGRRQIVQIASSLDEDAARGLVPKVIIFDEPTSSLSVAEADRLMAIVRQLAARGLLAIYVSHRMNEIFACCDRVSVLRDGKYVATSVVKQIDEPTLISQMIGRRIGPSANRRSGRGAEVALPEDGAAHNARPDAEPVLTVRGLNSPGRLREISLQVRAGEIVGLGGLVGAGRSELLDAIFGLDAGASGQISVGGAELAIGKPAASIAQGMGYVPEDRKLQGLFFDLGIGENTVMPLMPWLAGKFGWRKQGDERGMVRERFGRLAVKAASTVALPGSLSGGNQQKLLLARWLGGRTKVLLLDEPTRGIDVGTKTEIYKLVWRAADEGLAVLLVSSEMPELLALSDRVLVMCEGEITGELQGDEMTQQNILRLATLKHSQASAGAGGVVGGGHAAGGTR